MVVDANSKVAIHQRRRPALFRKGIRNGDWLASERCELPLNGRSSGWHVAQGVGIVNLAKDVVRQADAGNSPAAMQRGACSGAQLRRVVEVFVEGLQKSPMRHPELVDSPRWIAIRSK